MKIQTTRFSDLQVDPKDVLNFPEGILGFEHLKKFFIVDPGDNTLILWLQSITDENVAFPVIEPSLFILDYAVRLLPAEMSSLSLEDMKDSKIYCILTIPSDVTKMSANLKAPIIINSRINSARQIVLQDNRLPLRFEMYKELKKRVVNRNYSDDGQIEGSLSGSSLASSLDNDAKTAIVGRTSTVEQKPLFEGAGTIDKGSETSLAEFRSPTLSQ